MFKTNNNVNGGLGSFQVRKAKSIFLSLFFFLGMVAMANDFSAQVTSGCAPVVTRFTHTFNGVQNLVWNFGDGTTSTSPNPGKVYNQSGTYSVTLTVTLGNGSVQTVSKTNYIRVNAQPVPAFNAVLPANQCMVEAPVRFLDASSSNVVRRLWDFGDGSTSTSLNPTHNYTRAGSYTITLHAFTADSCYATSVQTIQVNFLEKPSATFVLQDSVFCSTGLSTTLSSSTQRGNIVGYQWSFGAGIPTSTSANPSVVYPSTGNYTTRLIVTASNGCKDTIQKTNRIVVRATQPRLSTYASSTCAGVPVSLGTTQVGGTATWNFSNGTTANGITIQQPFNANGSFSFTVSVTDGMGCTNVLRSNNNIVVSAPTSTLTIQSSACVAPYSITANATLTNATSVKMWLLNGNGQAVDSTVSNTFNTIATGSGNYQLKVRSIQGTCFSDSVYPIVLSHETHANYTTSVDSGCAPFAVQFTDASTTSSNDSIVARFWDFGNGITSTLTNPSVVFGTRGQFTVRLVVRTASGCSDTLVQEARIKAGNRPTAMFTQPDTAGCKTIIRRFQDQSTGNITSWLWNFGNGVTSTLQNPRPVAYATPGTFKTTLIVRDFGCSDTLMNDTNVTIFPPKAVFSTAQTIGCSLPHTVQFTNATQKGVSFRWIFGEPTSANNTDTTFHASHTYNSYGSFDVTLIATSAEGCTDTLVKRNYIKIADPKPGFVATDSVGCAPFTGRIRNTSTPGTYTYQFGSTTTTGTSHRFARPGKYTVKVVMTDSIGCVDSFQVLNQIWVKGLEPDFSATPTAGCAPFVSQFNAIAPAAAVVSYNWNFGDSTSASIANPSHNFTQKRNYTVRLSVTDTDGCVSSITKNNYITTTNPTAQFENPTEVCLGASVQFTNRAAGTNLRSFWSFGDGNTSTASNPSHTYAAAGTYTVKLVVTTASGCSDSIIKTNTIRVVKLQASVANARITGFCAPALVTFQNTTPGATTFRWNFGDSSSSILANPTHTYNKNGFFNVSLVVTNALGCSDTLKMDSMVRVVGPTPSFNFTQTQTCAPATVNFNNTSLNYRTALWDFRDGSLVRTNNASHVYTRAGSFNPILIVTDSLGCSASITSTQAVVVTGMPTASFGTNNRTVCAGSTIQFVDNSTGATRWNWNFGDGTSSSLRNPAHGYTTSGSYTVTLTVWNSYGCQDTAVQTLNIRINQRPTATFAASSTQVCMPTSVTFTERATSPNGPIVSYAWSFGDNTTTATRNPVKNYATAGRYDVSLKVTDIFGCTDSVSFPRYINVLDSTRPSNILAKVATVNNNRVIDLNWKPSTDSAFVQYKVFRKDETPAGSTFTLVHASTNRNDSAFTDVSARVNQTPYTYLVVQKNICNRESNLDLAFAHTNVFVNAAPSADVRKVGVDLKWTKYVGFLANTRGNTVANYKVYRKELTSNNFTLVATLSGDDTSYTDKGLCTENYTYMVEAIAQNGVISTSNWGTSRAAVFNYAGNMELMNATVTDNNKVALIWKHAPIENAATYQILRKDAISGNFLRIAEIRATDSTFVDQTADASVRSYSYQVRVVDNCGNISKTSNEANSIHLKMEINDFQVSLNWTATQTWKNGVKTYVVERWNPSTQKFDSIAATRGTSFNEDPSNLNLNAYEYRVRSIEMNGNEMFSTSNNVKSTLKPTIFIPTAFSPNGDYVNDVFKVVGMHMTEMELEVYNRWGELVFRTNNINEGWDGTFNGGDAPEGSYVVKVRATASNGEPIFKSGALALIRGITK